MSPNYLLSQWPTVSVVLFCVVGAMALFLNEILHSPDCPNYRGAPWWVRAPMFLWGAALVYRAVALWGGLAIGAPERVGWSGAVSGFFMTTCMAAFLIDTLRGRMSAKGWRTVNRIVRLMVCKPVVKGEAMATAAMRGFAVTLPGEHTLPPEIL